MGRKSNKSFETRLNVVHKYLLGESSLSQLAKEANAGETSVRRWITNYQSLGEAGLQQRVDNTVYSGVLKKAAVEDYLSGKGSLADIQKKYGIRSDMQLRNWIMKYNGHEKLKASGTGGTVIMTKGRTTSYDERVEIVKYCIEHETNYAVTAEKYQVSYQQVYQWVKKYETKGAVGLLDRRGKKKAESELSELEKLRAENKLLRAEKRRTELENAFLKKLDEIERRRS